jgi:TonB family protein
VSGKNVRPTSPSTEEVASLPASTLSAVAAALEVAPPAAPEAVVKAPSVPSAPVGPFFETTDVSEAPQVATRVEPQLPDDLRGRPVNEILVVRVLVSQSGHPARVSLLRKSKAGPSLDNAVIAAVNRWAFSPARRRGEAVSCWLNMGVPVGRAN